MSSSSEKKDPPSFDVIQWNKERYARDQKDIQERLDAMPGVLGDRIVALHEQQSASGFIKDGLDQVLRCRILDPVSVANPSFTVQYNPTRELRRVGAGRQKPPSGYKSENGGCFLCTENIEWQQGGQEMAYRFKVNERNYVVLCNPFPFMPTHVTIASARHEPQSWLEGENSDDPSATLSCLVKDLLSIIEQSPGFIGFYNGLGAGASIPGHRHYHVFRRPAEGQLFAAEQVARASDRRIPSPILLEGYPITCLYFNGDVASIVDSMLEFYDAWHRECASSETISVNITATHSVARGFELYFVPRNRQYSISAGRAEVVGGLEVFGEIALSREDEFTRLKSGQFTYDSIFRMLKSVEAPEAAALITAMKRVLHFGRRLSDH